MTRRPGTAPTPGRLLRKVGRVVGRLAAPARELALALVHRDAFASVERFVFFIGYPRSGHTLVGALLDAHPDALVAHELHALAVLRQPRRLPLGAPRLYAKLLLRSRWFGARGRLWSGYDYTVPGQWQGRWRTLRVIGDKRGGGSTQLLAADPAALDQLRATVAVPIVAIHHVRDPHDNIASIAQREGIPLADAAARYFRLADLAAVALRRLGPSERVDLHHEDLVADPRARLADLALALGLAPEPAWLDACARLVLPAPHRSREAVAWPPELLAEVARRMAAHPHLARYLRPPA
ncbi:MAG: hypothetical protein U1F43_28555 [Myxococcota bacterium]